MVHGFPNTGFRSSIGHQDDRIQGYKHGTGMRFTLQLRSFGGWAVIAHGFAWPAQFTSEWEEFRDAFVRVILSSNSIPLKVQQKVVPWRSHTWDRLCPLKHCPFQTPLPFPWESLFQPRTACSHPDLQERGVI